MHWLSSAVRLESAIWNSIVFHIDLTSLQMRLEPMYQAFQGFYASTYPVLY